MKTSRGEGGTVRAIGEDVSGIAISSSATMGDALPADADLRASGGELLRDSAGSILDEATELHSGAIQARQCGKNCRAATINFSS